MNQEFCKGDTCTELLDIRHGLCLDCEVTFHFSMKVERLTIIDASGPCLGCCKTVSRQVMFPTDCGHSFCFSCFEHCFYVDGDEYRLSVEVSGCPSCPNGCQNPRVGRQCECKEYDHLKNMWKRIHPSMYEFHTTMEEIIQKDIPKPTRKCPTCNKKPKRKRKHE